MSILLDLIIIAIIVLWVILSAKHGFVRTLIEVVGFIAAFVIAFTVSPPLADMTYEGFIKSTIVSSVDKNLNIENADAADKLWDSLPDVAKNYAGGLGISRDTLKTEVESASGSTEQVIEQISDKTVKPAVSKVLSIIYSTVIAIVLLIVFKLLAKLINKVVNISVAGGLNAVLGGLLGILKGAAFALIVCMVISVIVLFTNNGPGIFTKENIDSTYLFKLFYGISPFV
ncbi:MAG: CvpA family protein [Clostridia bacterium]|nr:CvpA family protein [Clostridia bacterium]